MAEKKVGISRTDFDNLLILARWAVEKRNSEMPAYRRYFDQTDMDKIKDEVAEAARLVQRMQLLQSKLP